MSVLSGVALVVLMLAHMWGAVIFVRRRVHGRNGITLALGLHMGAIAQMMAVQLIVVWFGMLHSPPDWRGDILIVTAASRWLVVASVLYLLWSTINEMRRKVG